MSFTDLVVILLLIAVTGLTVAVVLLWLRLNRVVAYLSKGTGSELKQTLAALALLALTVAFYKKLNPAK